MKELKPIDYKILFALVKNSRLSDRQLAKIVGASQPTVTRRRGILEKEGLLGYSAIPNLAKLGFEIIAVIFGKRDYRKHPETNLEKARKFAEEHSNIIFGSAGTGLDADRIAISIHKNYSEYAKFMQELQTEWIDFMDVRSFIININSKETVRPLSLESLADYLKKEIE